MAQTIVEESGEPGAPRRNGPTARSVLQAVARRPITLAGVTALAAGAAAAVWFLFPLPKSTAAVVFHVANSHPSLLGLERVGNDGNTYRQSQAAILKQRLTLTAVMRRPDVAQCQVFKEKSDPLLWLESNLTVETKRDSEYLRVSLEGDPPEELLTILSAVQAEYLKEVDARENGARRERLAKLEKTHQRYRTEIEQFHKRLDTIALALGSKDSQFLALNDAILKDSLMAAIRGLSEARNALQAADLGLPIVMGRGGIHSPPPARPEVRFFIPWVGALQTPDTTDLAVEVENEFRSDPALKQLEAEVSRARQILTGTQSLFLPGERPAAVVQAEEKVRAAEENRDRYRAEQRPALEAAIRKRQAEREQERQAMAKAAAFTVKKQEELAEAKVADLQKAMAKSNQYRVELDNIKSMMGQTEKLSDTLGETTERLKVELEAPARVEVADPPYVVPGLEGNRRLKFTLLTGLGVLGIGFATVVGWELRSRRFTYTEEVSAALGVRLIGSVPPLARHREVAGENYPVLTEAIDATRTVLVHGTGHPGLRVLVVASAVSGEGKTSLSGHLAISLARAGFRTLLVDGDLRSPTAQRVFEMPLGPGLCEVLERRVDVVEAVRPSRIPGLSVMTAGHWTAATRQALVGANWRTTKQQLSEDYDYVVVDTSPLLLVSDSLLLAREADGVVLSVLLGVSQVGLVEEAVARLQAIGARLCGVIANGASHAAHQYVHGYGRVDADAIPASSGDSGR